jgi:hypothetical protein
VWAAAARLVHGTRVLVANMDRDVAQFGCFCAGEDDISRHAALVDVKTVELAAIGLDGSQNARVAVDEVRGSSCVGKRVGSGVRTSASAAGRGISAVTSGLAGVIAGVSCAV